jgi:hypothetical protein
MNRLDPNPNLKGPAMREAPPLPKSEAAKVLRQAAEAYWRFAGSASDPNPYRMVAMRYHEQALLLEAGL